MPITHTTHTQAKRERKRQGHEHVSKQEYNTIWYFT